MKLEPLEPGDIVCNQCNGTGEPENNLVSQDPIRFITVPFYCNKCDGTGKLDWIEAVVGKKPIMLTANWSIDFSISDQLYDPKSADMDKGIDNIAKQMAKDIDKQILEGITNGTGTWGSNM